MQDKNLFIAICTKKQRTTSDNDLQRTFLPRGHLRALSGGFCGKRLAGSFQEIGLAIGMGLKTILPLEEGVERP